jgi:hypothetical protein
MKSSSEHLFNKKALLVSGKVGESAIPKNLNQAGGPGDLTRAVQKRGGNFSLGISKKSVKNRLNYSGNAKGGVDKKHNSYARFLARKVGLALREDKMTNDLKPGDCTENDCFTKRTPANWTDDNATGKSGNPGTTVRSTCGKKSCC